MAITIQELAKLTLIPPCTTNSPELLTHMQTAIATLEKASGHTFHLFKEAENDRTFYLSGQWDSTDAHYAFLPSPENQHLLNTLGPYVQVTFMFHILQQGDALLDGSVPCLQVAIYHVPSAKAVDFEAMYARVRPTLQRWTLQQRLATGWVAESRTSSNADAQFVVLSPWQDQSGPHAFSNSDDSKDYDSTMLEFLSGADIKHLTPWQI